MALEYQTLKFPNDANGLREKDRTMAGGLADGWRVVSESVEPGHMKGGEMCCGATICLPLAALAGRTSGYVVVTFAREAVPSSVQQHSSAGKRTGGPAVGSAFAHVVKWAKRHPLLAIVILALVIGILSLM